jgi:hypothetical protein
MASGAGRITETKTSYKTQGTNNVPASISGVTVQPAQSALLDNTKAPFNHDGNDVSGYANVTSEYRTYADLRNKPL